MKKKSSLSKIFELLALVTGSIWFGSYIARLLITYQMFEYNEIILKNYITDNNLSAIIQTNFPLVNLTFFSYLIFIICFSIFLILTSMKLKENGWLFIVSMIIYLTLPFEVILSAIDYKLIILFMNAQFSSDQVLKLITKRISLLNSFPIILVLSYLSIPYFLVFKPFTIKSKNEN